MEPVGFAVGIMGLVGLFNTCLGLLDKFDSWRDCGSDLRSLAAQFLNFASRIGVTRSGSSKESCLTNIVIVLMTRAHYRQCKPFFYRSGTLANPATSI
ncbi:hypothetical protein BDW68DRAFT_172015 [Aspergillus falconensis]